MIVLRNKATEPYGKILVDTETGTEYQIKHIFTDKRFPDTFWYKLPDNPTGRKYIKASLVTTDEYEVTNATERKPSSRSTKANDEFNWQKFVTEDEQLVIDEIVNKAKARAEEAKEKANSPIEKAKRVLEKAQAEYERLMKELGAQAQA